jgi:hypothetical protein
MRFQIKSAWLSAAVLAVLPGSGWAQLPPPLPSAADPSQVVPAVEYRSVFRDTARGVESESVDWRQANNDVGRFTRGHPDILKAEERNAAPVTAPIPPSNLHRH